MKDTETTIPVGVVAVMDAFVENDPLKDTETDSGFFVLNWRGLFVENDPLKDTETAFISSNNIR